MQSQVDTDVADPQLTFADIDPAVKVMLDGLSEREIRSIAKANKIVLYTREGNVKALLAELSRELRARWKAKH